MRIHYDKESGGEILPQGYTRLTYIQGDGERFIDLGIKGGDKNYVKIDCSSHQTMPAVVFGYYETTSPYSKCYLGLSATTSLGYAAGYDVGYSQNYRITQSVRYTIEFQTCSGNSYLKLDGTTLFTTNTVTTYTHNLNLYILARNNSNSAGNYNKARIYEMWVEVDDVLQGHFVPALRNSDGKPGLYNLTKNEFRTNTSGNLPYML